MKDLKKLVGKEFKSNFTFINGVGRIISPKIIINAVTPKGYANITVDYTGCRLGRLGHENEIVNGTYQIKKAKLIHYDTYNDLYEVYLDYRKADDPTSVQCFFNGFDMKELES